LRLYKNQMLQQFEHLTVLQVELLFDAPALVAILIAGSDNHMDPSEIERAMELVHIKTFSETSDLKEFYKELEPQFITRFNNLRKALPLEKEQRQNEIESHLSDLNGVLQNLPYKFAHNYYKSLKNYAVHIANASGGVGGVYKISEDEKKLMHLEMLREPQNFQE
jgi:hypothetical protein